MQRLELCGGIVSNLGGYFTRHRRLIGRGLLSVLLFFVGIAVLRTSASLGDQENQRPQLAKGERRRQKAKRIQFVDPVWDWVNDDVPYIITPEEVAAFKKLTTDDERQGFIESFWTRRNPKPVSPENDYEQKYYQRIVLANERFGAGIPGWKTDRGRIYIMYGPPDDIVAHPNGGTSLRPRSDGGPSFTHPFEEWHYGHIDDVGDNVILDFVDSGLNGDYRRPRSRFQGRSVDPTDA